MLTRKEFLSILIISIVLGVIISLVENEIIFLKTTLFVFIVILVNTAAKKAAGFYLDTDIEVKIWEMKQFWVQKHIHAKNYIPVGIFAPLIVKFISIGLINWMACLTFDASGKVYRAARRHGIYSFSEVSEEEMGWIAASGTVVTILFAVLAYLIGQETLTKISLAYAFFNIIPAFDWDGAKIFFGNVTLWSFLAVISLIGLVATFAII
ncbi:hypothetical protein J4411_02720 [Candidatus Pacearchaeota archaeon]|nr:hypothetical protein [Candidatus Pacearchaeota archaeon]